MDILYYILTAVGGIVVGVLVLSFINHKKAQSDDRQLMTAAEQAQKIMQDGIRQAEAKKKEILLEAKEDALRVKNEAEAEAKERRAELTQQERRLNQKEESIDRKTENIERKEETLSKKIAESDALRAELASAREEQLRTLEKISGFTSEQAKQLLITTLEDDVKHEQAMRLMELTEEFKDEADRRAKEIISTAIQRCAADHVAETTVSVVPLPSEDMKGRIIGREGRNIRAIENLTGVELIIDDTPEAITLSSFDPVRREVARLTIEKLISDGRIHPTRIEDTVERAKRDVDAAIKQAGEKATFETDVHGLNPEVIKLLGRLRYRTSYGQNVLNHSIEVSVIAGIIADELGVDSTLAKRAGLLHDIGKALTAEAEGSHVELGVEVLKKYKENKDVIHAVEAHHGDVEPQTIVAVIIQAADAISAARPGARRENLENYFKRLEKLEEIAKQFQGVEKTYALQAGREIRIMVKPEEVNDETMVLIARDIAKKIEAEMEYPGQIKVNLIRESRVTDYAK